MNSLPKSSNRSSNVDRRDFLETAAAVSAGLFAGLTTESAQGFAANDVLNVACIGTGGRCRHLMKSLREVPKVRIAAVCDIYDFNLAEGAETCRPQGDTVEEFPRDSGAQGHRRSTDRQP